MPDALLDAPGRTMAQKVTGRPVLTVTVAHAKALRVAMLKPYVHIQCLLQAMQNIQPTSTLAANES